jgi:hypothetical protein
VEKDTMRLPDRVADLHGRGRITTAEADAFRDQLRRVEAEVYSHEVIRWNPYTKWFKQGNANTAQVKELIVQFSVFSNHFIPLEAKRMVNAATEAEECEARSILGNEIGVPINRTTGNIEGFRFSHEFAHIKWLRDIGEMLGLSRDALGRWALGSASTHRFLTELEQVYGNPDNNVGSGASFAIESWAGYGIGQGEEAESDNFWKELVVGLEAYNRKHREPEGLPRLDVSFFQHHFDLEVAHVVNVETELTETFFGADFDADKWHYGARHALDAMLVFWKGLEESRLALAG